MNTPSDGYTFGYLQVPPTVTSMPQGRQIDRSGVSGSATSLQQIRSSPARMSSTEDGYSDGFPPPTPRHIERSGASRPAASVQEIRKLPVAQKNELGRIGIGLRLDTALKVKQIS
jgi:hypothetical protein